MTPTKKMLELKEWFEANYLDGDKIQKGQILSSEECFNAITQALAEERVRVVKHFNKTLMNNYEKEVYGLGGGATN